FVAQSNVAIFSVIWQEEFFDSIPTAGDCYVLKKFFMIWMMKKLHRHGDRTPFETYPNDPYRNDSFWPDGFGRLTLHGKLRMFRLGKYLRNRYVSFLTDNPREVKIRSSITDRCLNSVQLIMAGAYPPKGRWVWNQNFLWQPFPVKTLPKKLDGLLETQSYCPKATIEINKVYQTKDFIEYANHYSYLYPFLTEKSGRNINSIWAVDDLYDILISEKHIGYRLPNWVNKTLLETLINVSGQMFYFEFSTETLQRLRAGLFLKEIKNVFEDALKFRKSKNEIPIKLNVYSAHDTNVAAVLNALGVFNKQPPPFGSTIIFELYGNENRAKQMKVYYLNVTESENPLILRLPACNYEETCDFDAFLENVKKLIVEDWRKECGLPKAARNFFNFSNVDIVNRHGEKTPIGTFPNDLYRDNSFWPEGRSQLTIMLYYGADCLTANIELERIKKTKEYIDYEQSN
ncbi:lysosomal acid phosphatase-like protein 3, partial [Dinothrombium tinctorium]